MGSGRTATGSGARDTTFCASNNRPDLILCAVDFSGSEPAPNCFRRAADAPADFGIPATETQSTIAQIAI